MSEKSNFELSQRCTPVGVASYADSKVFQRSMRKLTKKIGLSMHNATCPIGHEKRKEKKK